MSEYFTGDVLLAQVRLSGPNPVKVRPVVVVENSSGEFVTVCPVSSRQYDPSSLIPVGLDDFENGGLDLFDDSYILIHEKCSIRKNAVAGKKGRLTSDKISEIKSALKSR